MKQQSFFVLLSIIVLTCRLWSMDIIDDEEKRAIQNGLKRHIEKTHFFGTFYPENNLTMMYETLHKEIKTAQDNQVLEKSPFKDCMQRVTAINNRIHTAPEYQYLTAAIANNKKEDWQAFELFFRTIIATLWQAESDLIPTFQYSHLYGNTLDNAFFIENKNVPVTENNLLYLRTAIMVRAYWEKEISTLCFQHDNARVKKFTALLHGRQKNNE